ncbi:MAG: 2-dehydro-3-deoxy-6-phosphogalactonate aldolase [Paucimonas sp.]|nr:2-dehydro-3-deoxy-6-phosphogalactonate aldolase [Paucimonas sp.]
MRQHLGTLPLVAILRGLTVEEAPHVGAVLFEAGFHLLEVPLNRPGALEAIRILVDMAPEGAIVGGGTMLSIEHVEQVYAAGGRMLVSPNFDGAVVRRAVELDMLALPGVATPTEAYAALAAGAHGLKLFPAEMMPPAVVKALRSVLPSDTPLMPVGGITPDNMAAYVRAGANGFGIGGALYQPTIEPGALKKAAANFMAARQLLMTPGGG